MKQPIAKAISIQKTKDYYVQAYNDLTLELLRIRAELEELIS